MACEQNILDIPASVSLPADTDVVIMTLADGSTIIRQWGLLKAAISAAQKRSVTVADGVLYNLPAGSLLKRIVYAGSGTPTLDIGTTAMGTEIAEDWDTADSNVLIVDKYYSGAQAIYITGLSGSQNLIIFYE